MTLTREELYEKVWATPMQKLAAEFGLSDRGLAKLCGRYQIPVPPRGYWARVQFGQSVKRPPLPSVAGTGLGMVEIYSHEKRQPEQGKEVGKQEVPSIKVVENGPLTHPIALRIEKCLSGAKKAESGVLLPRSGMAVPIQVSAEQLPRALRICDALLQAMETKEYRLTWAKPYDEFPTVTVLGESLTFLISEDLERKDRQDASGETSRQEPYSLWQRPKWDYAPTGRLKLAIECGESLGVRRRWSDGKKRRIEDVLGHFLISLTVVAQALKRHREEQAEWERRWEEKRKREAEVAALRAEQRRKAEEVEGFAHSWEQSKSLRKFAERLSSETERGDIPEEQRQDLRCMAEWAMRHAELIDPFTHLAWMINQFKGLPRNYGP